MNSCLTVLLIFWIHHCDRFVGGIPIVRDHACYFRYGESCSLPPRDDDGYENDSPGYETKTEASSSEKVYRKYVCDGNGNCEPSFGERLNLKDGSDGGDLHSDDFGNSSVMLFLQSVFTYWVTVRCLRCAFDAYAFYTRNPSGVRR